MTALSTRFWIRLLLLGIPLACGCAHTPRSASYPSSGMNPDYREYHQEGLASWYGPGFHGHRTASGERFNTHALTCAHKTLPFGTKLKVTNLDTGQALVVTVNDRGPFIHGRIIDVSHKAAQELDLLRTGVAKVKIETVPPSEYVSAALEVDPD